MNLLSKLRPLIRATKSNLVLARRDGHAKILTPYPSPFLFRQFKNVVHFYCFVTLVPTVLVLSYINIVIGNVFNYYISVFLNNNGIIMPLLYK